MARVFPRLLTPRTSILVQAAVSHLTPTTATLKDTRGCSNHCVLPCSPVRQLLPLDGHHACNGHSEEDGVKKCGDRGGHVSPYGSDLNSSRSAGDARCSPVLRTSALSLAPSRSRPPHCARTCQWWTTLSRADGWGRSPVPRYSAFQHRIPMLHARAWRTRPARREGRRIHRGTRSAGSLRRSNR